MLWSVDPRGCCDDRGDPEVALSEEDDGRECERDPEVLGWCPLFAGREPERGGDGEPTGVVWEWCDGGCYQVDGSDGGCGEEEGLSALCAGSSECCAEECEECDGEEE